ncbi:hypothetical protein B0O99DRAFT_592147 [Bisporella sp. PMI_857]|nr:hypothetical protein B0O99DRAFT_592147 [Bisporella sp. PMI_857]
MADLVKKQWLIPPTYQKVNVGVPLSPTVSNSSSLRFPRTFGVYRASGSFTSIQIGLSADAPPLFHISTRCNRSSGPKVLLHAGLSATVMLLASADFHSLSNTIDIQIGNDMHSLMKNGMFSSSYTFHAFLSSTGKNERFEWKSSSCAEVTSLQGSRRGMKLTRMSTGEVVAAWARPHSGNRKKGKLGFMARDRNELGDKFEVISVMAILALALKGGRKKSSCNGAAAGGLAGGAVGGGGGC